MTLFGRWVTVVGGRACGGGAGGEQRGVGEGGKRGIGTEEAPMPNREGVAKMIS